LPSFSAKKPNGLSLVCGFDFIYFSSLLNTVQNSKGGRMVEHKN
jgi:hypothetical protein